MNAADRPACDRCIQYEAAAVFCRGCCGFYCQSCGNAHKHRNDDEGEFELVDVDQAVEPSWNQTDAFESQAAKRGELMLEPGQDCRVTVEGQWIVVERLCECNWFSISDIIRLESPVPTGKPCGWSDYYAGKVYMRGESSDRDDGIYLTRAVWEQLLPMLGTSVRGP